MDEEYENIDRSDMGDARLLDPTKRYISSARDYTEDFSGENGKYLHKCEKCNCIFLGHKRRPSICKVCLEKQPRQSPGCDEILFDF